jgi:RNA ligase (TIGR02306 family)
MKLTTITKILALEPIPNADKIEKAKILGYDCVVMKGLHKVGDSVVFIFPDVEVPKSLLDKEYVGDERVRIKTVRLRGQFSAGLVLPISILAPVPPEAWQEGQDVAELLNITKWEAPVNLALNSDALGTFPTGLISRTDEDNYLSFPDAIQELLTEERFKGQELVASLKLDGQSGTYLIDPETNEFMICSRNLKVKPSGVRAEIAEKYKIEQCVRDSGNNLGIQGEIFGGKINGGKVGNKQNEFNIFLIKDLNENRWFSWDETVEFCRESNYLVTVPELFRVKVGGFNFEDLQNVADETKYPNGGLAEGIVLRTVNPIYSNALGKSWWSVKIMNRIYDMKKG